MKSDISSWRRVLDGVVTSEIPFQYIHQITVVLSNNSIHHLKNQFEYEKFMMVVDEILGDRHIQDMRLEINHYKLRRDVRRIKNRVLAKALAGL